MLASVEGELTSRGLRHCDTCKADAGVSEDGFECFGVGSLHEYPRILSEEELDEVPFWEGREIYRQTTRHIGEAHLQQGSDETTGRDVVTCDQHTTLEELLDSSEGFTEVFGLFDTGCFVPELTQRLCQSRPTEGKGSKAEVDMVDRVVGTGQEYG